MKIKHLFILIGVVMACFCACDDDDSYAERVKRERKQISAFLQSGVQIMAEDSSGYLLDIPGNIKVISESEFYANDSTTNVDENEYVLFSGTGVYMQIVRKGDGNKLADGETAYVLNRYTEYNISGDSIQSSNNTLYYATYPDKMSCTNTDGIFTATFTSGVMYTTYSSASVPSGWLIPLAYVNLGRQTSEDGVALVRLIVPSSEGQADASTQIYPCFYEISYQRGR